MTQEPAKARIAGFVASEADIAVILRKGRDRIVRMLVWNLTSDEVIPGQWLKARIDPSACDLSPDGRLFVGGFTDYSRRHREPGLDTDGWTAVSRPPSFTALAVWFDTQLKGGFWDSSRALRLDYRLGTRPHKGTLPEWVRARVSPEVPLSAWPMSANLVLPWTMQRDPPSSRLGEPHVEASEARLLRDGWLPEAGEGRVCWQRRFPGGRLARRDTLDALDTDGEVRLSLPSRSYGWSFLDLDHRSRVIYADAGCLWAWADFPNGEAILIADLNDMTFEPIEAPAWAREWPEPMPEW